jgi:hypothetical protein
MGGMGMGGGMGGGRQQQSSGAPQHSVANRLFVGGLNDLVSDEQLKQHFSQFGAVKDCYIPKEASGKQRGYGYGIIRWISVSHFNQSQYSVICRRFVHSCCLRLT